MNSSLEKICFDKKSVKTTEFDVRTDYESIRDKPANFRYPTSYSLEYRFDNKKLDISNVYLYLNFLDGCDSMLDAIADFECEMRTEYESEMRASMDWQ